MYTLKKNILTKMTNVMKNRKISFINNISGRLSFDERVISMKNNPRFQP